MATNYGPTTKEYIRGLKAELEGLDQSDKETFDAQSKLINAELKNAQDNLKLEEKERAAAEDAEVGE